MNLFLWWECLIQFRFDFKDWEDQCQIELSDVEVMYWRFALLVEVDFPILELKIHFLRFLLKTKFILSNHWSQFQIQPFIRLWFASIDLQFHQVLEYALVACLQGLFIVRLIFTEFLRGFSLLKILFVKCHFCILRLALQLIM